MNIKFLKLFLFLICMQLMQSQTQRFEYAYQGNVSCDPSRPIIQNDIIVLDINPNEIFSYSHKFIENDSVVRSTKKIRFPALVFDKIIRYKRGVDKVEHIQRFGAIHYHIDIQKITNWKLLNETKKIGPYTVKKAQTNYGERTWNAWYCPDITLPYGPYLFQGLPGLIIEISDDQNQYSFSLIANKNISKTVNHEDTLLKYLGLAEVKMKEKDWQKFIENNYENPIPRLLTGEFMMKHEDGREFSSQDYQNEIKRLQKQMLLNNNPLELNYKIKNHN